MSLSVLVGIDPPEEVVESILTLRKEIAKITEDDKWQKRVPHISLYYNTFPALSPIEETVISVLGEYRTFKAGVKGVHSFGYDPISTKHVCVYLLERSPELVHLQRTISESLSPMRTEEFARGCLKATPNPTQKQMETLKKWGSFFGPDDWNPHASIAGVPAEHYAAVWELAQKKEVHTEWKVNSVNIYTKTDENPHKFYRSISLK